MYATDIAGHATQLTFGRETAQFKEFLTFMTVVSVILWVIVLATMLLRLWLGHVWYRKRLRASENPNNLSP
ncbi:MAG TPA: hypothetical protein VMB52_02940 [Verrucomicrobiae bacterium]|nr:hypothetical protein [Verrucomicrobiae bacterium]